MVNDFFVLSHFLLCVFYSQHLDFGVVILQ